jgi:transposase
MKPGKTNTKSAGIDVGKRCLDVAVHGDGERLQLANEVGAFADLIAWLKAKGVGRVGMEATGGYERGVRHGLEKAGFEVVIHQPLEVRLFARLRRMRAKNDRIDAVIIAAATAQVDAVKAAGDPRLAALAEWMTAYEQITDQLAELRTFMEHVSLKEVSQLLKRQIRTLESLKATLAAKTRRQIEAHADLRERYRLLLSLPGVGPITAMGLVIRMPELGRMKRGQAAALLGVAPFDRDSGQFKGQRFIGGGRKRPRRLVYLAALAAKRCDPSFKAFAQGLARRAKPPKVIVVAVMRRLIEAANLVVARGHPWTVHAPA